MGRLLLIFILAQASVAVAAKTELNLYIPGSDSNNLQITVPRDGLISVQFVVKGIDPQKKHRITMTKFRGDSGDLVDVIFTSSASPTLELNAKAKSLLITTEINASTITLHGPYKGELLVQDESEVLNTSTLTLSRAIPSLTDLATSDATIKEHIVASNGRVVVPISTGELGGDPALGLPKATLTLSRFIGSDGSSVSVAFLPETFIDTMEDEADKMLGSTLADIPLPSGPMHLVLEASKLKLGETYTGTLTVSTPIASPPPISLQLKRPSIQQDAALLAEIPPPQPEVICWWGKCQPPPIDIILREQSGAHEVRGLSVTWGSADTGTQWAFNPADVELMLNPPQNRGAVTLVDLRQLRPEDMTDMAHRSIPPYGKSVLQVQFPKLPAGEHKIPLKLLAVNAKEGKTVDITLQAIVLRPWIYAALVLFAAIVISYVVTKRSQNSRKSQVVDQRIASFSARQWLKHDRSNMLPIVQAAAIVARAREAMEREGRGWALFLKSAAVVAEVEKSMDRLDARAEYLERLSRLWEEWDSSTADDMVKNRARKLLRDIEKQLGQLQPDEDVGDETRTRLTELENWRDPDKRFSSYWSSLQVAMRELIGNVVLEDYDQEEDSLQELRSSITDTRKISPRLASYKEAMTLLQSLSADIDSNDPERPKVQNALTTWLGLDQTQPDILQESFENISMQLTEFDNMGIKPILQSLKALDNHLRNTFWQDARKIYEGLQSVNLQNEGHQAQLEKILQLTSDVLVLHGNILKNILPAVNNAENIAKSGREIVRHMLLQLGQDKPPASPSKAIMRERLYYSPLKLIIDQRTQEQRNRLIDMCCDKKGVKELFQEADNRVWQELKSTKAIFIKPKEKKQQEAYALIDFEVAPHPHGKDISNTFAFKHGFNYQWHITFNEEVGGETVERILHPVTQEPRVTQFIPLEKVSVQASVTVINEKISGCDDERQLLVGPITFTTSASKRLKRLHGLRRGERLYLAIAMVAAFTFGIQSEQFIAAQKGSWVALFLLFAWGVAADQIKNRLANPGASDN